MAKKDTYLALLRRGIDENTAQLLADSGIKVGDLKKLDEEKLRNNSATLSIPKKSNTKANAPFIISRGPKINELNSQICSLGCQIRT